LLNTKKELTRKPYAFTKHKKDEKVLPVWHITYAAKRNWRSVSEPICRSGAKSQPFDCAASAEHRAQRSEHGAQRLAAVKRCSRHDNLNLKTFEAWTPKTVHNQYHTTSIALLPLKKNTISIFIKVNLFYFVPTVKLFFLKMSFYVSSKKYSQDS
jgi:hypothetical protein